MNSSKVKKNLIKKSLKNRDILEVYNSDQTDKIIQIQKLVHSDLKI
jgi:hypothetical protein